MCERRRHADNFTDSLSSFREFTDSETELDYHHRQISQDSLDEVSFSSANEGAYLRENKLASYSTSSTRSSKHSIILASSATKNSTNNASNATKVQSNARSEPDLNKRIDLFYNDTSSEQPKCKTNEDHSCLLKRYGINDNKENKDPQCTSKKSTTNNVSNGNSKRDTNYNIRKVASRTAPRTEKHPVNGKGQSRFIQFGNKSSTPLPSVSDIKNYNKKEKENDELSSTNSNANKDEKKFEALLCSLDNQLNQIKEVSRPQQILRRLSDKYVHSPKNFTEKLLTIIEESIANNDENDCCASAINLSRLTTEFRKMCKFIEDESIPEWPPSPLSTPPCVAQTKPSPVSGNTSSKIYQDGKFNMNMKSFSSTTPHASVPRMKNSRRLFQKMAKNMSNLSVDNIPNLSLNEYSNISFECLEAQCRKLFHDEQESIQRKRRSLSLPSLMSMSDIQIICEKQMAALNVSDTVIKVEDNTTINSPSTSAMSISENAELSRSENLPFQQAQEFSSSKLQQELHHKSEDLQYNNASCGKRKLRKVDLKTEFEPIQTEKFSSNYINVNPDELEKTLLQDIAEKRKRCLDTAKLIMEINADLEVTEAQKSLRASSLIDDDNEPNSLSCNEAKFLNTLMSCKKYHTYLKKQKPLLDLCQNSELSTSGTVSDENYNKSTKTNEIIPNTQKIPSRRNIDKDYLSPNIVSYSTYKSSPLKEQSKESKPESERPKLFVTPGKSATNKNIRKKPIYFPNMDNALKNTEKHILKSPHAAGLYRLNYNTIMSPVGMYIRGTDMQLIKNVRAKTDHLLLTPTKKETTGSPVQNTGRTTPFKSINKTQEKLPLKVNLSPKICTTPEVQTQSGNSEKKTNTPSKLEHHNVLDNNFVLPKVSYKLPLQVRTIKETEKGRTGNRVRQLLNTAQNKVVIRHQGRNNSTQKKRVSKDGEIFEINYNPEDESIHIEQAASKTNFIRKRRNV